MLAAVAGVALIAAGKATCRSQIAFGPFMLAGALAVIIAAVTFRLAGTSRAARILPGPGGHTRGPARGRGH